MSEQTIDRQLFLGKVAEFNGIIHLSLGVPNPTPAQLAGAAQAVIAFKQFTTAPGAESFRLIADQLEIVFNRHLSAETLPSSLELELVELAIDWLDQLAILYEEQLPEPKSLVAELIYTFNLVESSQDAVTLAELIGSHAEKSSADPFSDDPEFSVKKQPVSFRRDPFAEDPGFGLEFDLLQRTVNFLTEERFAEEGSDGKSDEEEKPSPTEPSDTYYDFFADDPPLSK